VCVCFALCEVLYGHVGKSIFPKSLGRQDTSRLQHNLDLGWLTGSKGKVITSVVAHILKKVFGSISFGGRDAETNLCFIAS
jgi:hypothetical protein